MGEVGVVGKAVFPFKLSSLSALLTRPSEPALVVGVAVEPWLLERFFPMDPFLKRTSCRGVEILVYSSAEIKAISCHAKQERKGIIKSLISFEVQPRKNVSGQSKFKHWSPWNWETLNQVSMSDKSFTIRRRSQSGCLVCGLQTEWMLFGAQIVRLFLSPFSLWFFLYLGCFRTTGKELESAKEGESIELGLAGG